VTPAQVRDLITATTGEHLALDQLVPQRRDWRWLVELPGDRILFIPTDTAGASRLANERRLLAALAPRIELAVPQVIGAVDAALDLRTRVPGLSGAPLFGRITQDPACAEPFGVDLARVLAGLHAAFSLAEVRDLVSPPRADTYPLAEPALRAVVPSLPDELRALADAALDRYAALPPDDLVLVHNDVAIHNLAFDPVTLRVVGVFDFEGAACGGRHLDFKYVPSYGPNITTHVLAHYRALTEIAISPARMRLLQFATALSYWEWRERDPADHDANSGRDRDIALAWVGMAAFALRPDLI